MRAEEIETGLKTEEQLDNSGDTSEQFRAEIFRQPDGSPEQHHAERFAEEREKAIQSVVGDILAGEQTGKLAEQYGHKNEMARQDYHSLEIRERREKIDKLFQDAHKEGKMDELVERLNDELAKAGSPYRFSVSQSTQVGFINPRPCDRIPGGPHCPPDFGFSYQYTQWNVMLTNTQTNQSFDTAEFSDHLHRRGAGWR